MENRKREYWPTEHWRKCSPEDVGMDKEILNEAHKEIRTVLKTVNSFLVVKNGYIVFEKYYNDFNKDSEYPVMSVTKSFISALIGILIDKKYISGVNEKVLDIFPEYINEDTDYLMRDVTIKDLLTMTSGMHWKNRNMREPMIDRLCRSKNWTEFILNLPVDEKNRGKFLYNSSSSQLLSAIITKTTGMNAQDFANEYLFNTIGIERIEDKEGFKPKSYLLRDLNGKNKERWSKDPQGNNTGGFGLSLKARDMARFGYLFLNNGVWNGKQVISSDWVCESTKKHSEGNGIGSYGYQWWIKNDCRFKTYFALGYGGQYIINTPKLDLTVVMTSKSNLSRWLDPVYIFDEYVLKGHRDR